MSAKPEDSLENGVQEPFGPPSRSENLDVEDSKNDSVILPEQLQEEDHRARGRNAELQAQLASYFNRKDPRDRDEDPEPDAQEYEECLKRLVHLRRQKSSRLESARRHEEKLRLREREQLKQVEDEWESVSTLKGKLAVSLLSGHFWAPEAARAKVEATLEDERLARRELRTLRLKHAETEGRVGRLEALLRAEEGEQDKARDLLLLQFEQMLTQRTRRTKVDERGQEASGLRKNMKRTLELLSNMKEKLHWIQTEVQAKRDQLAQLEATLSAGRDLLARTRRARAGLRRDNAELRRRRGLLGDALLLRDFGVTAGAARRLQEELEKLKSWREERASAPSGQF